MFHYRDGNFPSSLQFFRANSEQNKPYMAANVSVPLGLAPRYREDGYFWDATATVHTPKKEGKDLSLSLLTTQNTQSANVYHTAYKEKPQICTKCP